jgi:hypothetical protein
MLYKTGIYIHAEIPSLVETLTSELERLGCNVDPASSEPPTSLPDNKTTISIMQWTDEWVRLHFTGEKNWMGEIVEGAADGPLRQDIVHCYYEPEMGEYSYTYYKSGKLVETFSSSGPGLGTIVFRSELRKIPVGNIIDARKFMTESMSMLGLEPLPATSDFQETVWICFSPPEKKSFLKLLLGA